MNMLSAAIVNLSHDSSTLLMALLVFLATGTMAFSVMAFARVRGSVRRRTSRLADEGERGTNSKRSLRYSSLRAVTHLIDYTTKHYSEANDENLKVLRKRLVQAGIYDQRGIAFFFIARPMIASHGTTLFWLMLIVAGIVGYVGPSIYIDKRISARKVEH
ncbi:MAG TPA: hypothetical protein VFC54_02220, partial [Pseudolabrys sp.]|nr:hypothetical protein [Pseudolabrys sp.]